MDRSNTLWQKIKGSSKPFLVLAPLDGVTDFVFREIVAETAKPDVLFTEFTNVEALNSKGYERTIPRLKFSPKQHPIVAQLWGLQPENFKKAAAMVKELGFDGIDLNFGCPDKAVLKIGACSAMIKNPALAAEIISATKEDAQGLPISVKTRIGIKQIETEKWVGFLLEQNLDAITIHGRTVAELSKVPAHWDEIGKAVKLRDKLAPNTVIIGNGDISTREQALEMHKTYGVDGVMIGRGIFDNPWLFEHSPKKHSTHEHLQLLLKHTKLYCETYPEAKKFDPMKKFFKNYVRGFDGANHLKQQLMETTNYDEVEKIISLSLRTTPRV